MTFTLLAFLWLERPLLAGATLAVAAGVLFYPAFFFPIWFAWYWFRGRGAVRFASGFAIAASVIALGVVVFSQPGADEGALRLFLESTLEHQEGAGELEYGTSPFSFWTHHPRAAAVFQVPLVGDTSLLKLSFLMFAGFCDLLAFLARGRSVAQLAALTGAAAAALQLWKTHATGTYVEWYLPFLMIGLFIQAQSTDTKGGSSPGIEEDADPGGPEPSTVGAG